MEKCTDIPEILSDNDIIELFWERSERAIDETDRKYGKMLFHIAYNFLHDQSDCEECKNDTYLGVWNTIPPTRPTVFSAFISKIMRNTAVNRYKEKNGMKNIPSELTSSLDELDDCLKSETTTEELFDAKELGRLISEYIRTLNDRQAYIFVERYYLSETVQNIADALGIGLASVHRESEKMKKGLRAYLEENGVYI